MLLNNPVITGLFNDTGVQNTVQIKCILIDYN
jgi:hypothetical protein